MRHYTVLLLAVGLGLAACSDRPTSPDNTAVNARDRKDDSVTAGDQGMSQADTDLTAKIRSAIVDDDSLSVTAKNIKIVTQNGKVTLKGPVANAEEKAKILQKATSIAGAGRVEDNLEVTS